jgi:hypothetical protein
VVPSVKIRYIVLYKQVDNANANTYSLSHLSIYDDNNRQLVEGTDFDMTDGTGTQYLDRPYTSENYGLTDIVSTSNDNWIEIDLLANRNISSISVTFSDYTDTSSKYTMDLRNNSKKLMYSMVINAIHTVNAADLIGHELKWVCLDYEGNPDFSFPIHRVGSRIGCEMKDGDTTYNCIGMNHATCETEIARLNSDETAYVPSLTCSSSGGKYAVGNAQIRGPSSINDPWCTSATVSSQFNVKSSS